MQSKIFKVHTDTFGRLSACLKHAMYGVSLTAIREQMPIELAKIQAGDIVFISEKEISKNALPGRDKLSQKWSLESEPLWGWSC
jgi:hypothetical protein